MNHWENDAGWLAGGEIDPERVPDEDRRARVGDDVMTANPLEGLTEARPVPGYAGNKRDHLTRLAKVEGQVRGIAHMVDEDRYCIDVLTQVAAATKALQQVALGLLDDRVQHCVSAAARSSAEEADAKLAEVTRAVALALRL
jgi:DNA-binding FrmR family transcriptional regulator